MLEDQLGNNLLHLKNYVGPKTSDCNTKQMKELIA